MGKVEFFYIVLALLGSFWMFTSKRGFLIGAGLGTAVSVAAWLCMRAYYLYH